MDETLSSIQGKQIAEYTYNYWYLETTVQHTIKEYYHDKNDVRMVVLEKETRKGDLFVRLPRSLWITKDGYPPLVTDGALKNPLKEKTLYFAGLPTVQSKDHVSVFDGTLRHELRELGLDYDRLSKRIKEGGVLQDYPITGFLYLKEGSLDTGILPALEKKVLNAYVKVLQQEPENCPVDLFVKDILGSTAVREYHLFKEEGFDVPFSGQKAFFTMMMESRAPGAEGQAVTG